MEQPKKEERQGEPQSFRESLRKARQSFREAWHGCAPYEAASAPQPGLKSYLKVTSAFLQEEQNMATRSLLFTGYTGPVSDAASSLKPYPG